MKNLLLVLLVLILSGCGSQTSHSSTSSEVPEAQPSVVWIQKYREDTAKAQPELISNLTNQSEISNLYSALTKEKSDKNIEVEQLTELYMLKFETLKDKVVIKEDYYIYSLTTNKDVVYAKKVTINSSFNLETFDKKQIPTLIDVAGKDKWIILNKNVLADALK